MPELEKSAEWHAERLTGIGGSDCAAACGMSRWKSQYELYLEKTGQVAPSDDIGPKGKWGLRLEEAIAAGYEEETGLKPERRPKLIRSEKYPFMIGHLDFVVDDPLRGFGVLEIKNVSIQGLVHWGPPEQGADAAPIEYVLQTLHYMALSDEFEWGALVPLMGGNQMQIYDVPKSQAMIDDIIRLEADFWQRIQTGQPPEIDFAHPKTGNLMKRLYPGTNGMTVDLDEKAQHWHEVVQTAAVTEKEYRQIKEGGLNHLRALMGEAAIGRLPDGTAYTRKLVKRKEYVVKATEYIDFRHTKKGKEQA